MQLEDITAALATADAKAALPMAVAQADALAPAIYALAGKFSKGVYLLPADRNLLFHGLHVLAAARHPGLCEHVLEIARQPEDDLERLFPYHASVSLARLLLSVWDRDAGELFTLIEHADIETDAKWALFAVLARLTFDGRIPRQDSIALLARIERDSLIDDNDPVWAGWSDAVIRLGHADMEPALRRVWAKPVFTYDSDSDRAEDVDRFRHAVANPADPGIFEEDNIKAVDDPVEGIAWVEKQASVMAAFEAELKASNDGADPDAESAAVEALRLTGDEEYWLSGFLTSRQIPAGTMTLEMLDGFFTALIIGPATPALPDVLSDIWDFEGSDAPEWDSPEQERHIHDLLRRHWCAIAARHGENAPHRPIVDGFGMARPGEEWAVGFVIAMDRDPDAWDAIFEHRRAANVVMPIVMLSGQGPEDEQADFSDDRRQAAIERLPSLLTTIAAFWRDPESGLPRLEPLRSTKVGRNEPCPCGSGKKYKKCCGAKTPEILH